MQEELRKTTETIPGQEMLFYQANVPGGDRSHPTSHRWEALGGGVLSLSNQAAAEAGGRSGPPLRRGLPYLLQRRDRASFSVH